MAVELAEVTHSADTLVGEDGVLVLGGVEGEDVEETSTRRSKLAMVSIRRRKKINQSIKSHTQIIMVLGDAKEIFHKIGKNERDIIIAAHRPLALCLRLIM